MKNRRFAHLPDLDRLDDRCLLSGLTPAQLTHAYGLDAISFGTAAGTTVTGNGAGETIALIEAYHDPTLASDLKTFDRAFQLPDPNLTVLNLAGSRTDSGWKLKESLDVEWAHAIAPGANILVVEARSESLQDLMAAVKDARNTPGVVAISMSWGMSEFRSESAVRFPLHEPQCITGNHVRRVQRRWRCRWRRTVACRVSQCPLRRRHHIDRDHFGELRRRVGLEGQQRGLQPVRAGTQLSAIGPELRSQKRSRCRIRCQPCHRRAGL